MGYLSHTPAESGRIGQLKEHLESVAERAGEFAAVFDADQEARIAGLLHDLGKYSELFQARLRGEVHGLDHWSIGAWATLTQYKASAVAAALAIQGHHAGLQSAQKASLATLEPEKLKTGHPLGLKIPDESIEKLLERLQSEVGTLPAGWETQLVPFGDFSTVPAQAMFSTRMLFSALVDADFIETEAHFQSQSPIRKTYREQGPRLDPRQALSRLQGYLAALRENSDSVSVEVDQVRQTLMDSCLREAEREVGVYTLTAPTGAGKTLSSLAFALKHAANHNLRRVIVVLPFLSLIEQTVGVFRDVFAKMPESFVLEDHSLVAEDSGDAESDVDRHRQQARILTENWDAPLIVTTGVRFLECLFANRPGACRKLHNLSNAVIIMDEVQTLPLNVTIPTLATLSHLSQRFRSTVVFSTATQPAFNHLDTQTRKYAASGWSSQEISPNAEKMFKMTRRTRISVDPEPLTDWNALVGRSSDHSQVMFIVNLKRHAFNLVNELESVGREGLIHLSTNMCPEHRKHVLVEVRRRLKAGEPCYLVSTQCVEAGVDIDFPAVYRAMAPLDSIVQAAGRCNRNGKRPVATVHVFSPPADDRGTYPSGFYQQAAGVTELVLKNRSVDQIDTADLELFTEYYRTLYSFANPESLGKDLQEAIKRRDFAETAKYYRIIPHATLSVLVPYNREAYDGLRHEAETEGINAKWIRRARGHSVGIYQTKSDLSVLERVNVRFSGEEARDWAILTDDNLYDDQLGLTLGLPARGDAPQYQENILIA
jgi:CRISPR-associated helicase Cas3/CRISPR-associated endonuclease Cas3-HD